MSGATIGRVALVAAAICVAMAPSPAWAADVAALPVAVNGSDVSVSVPAGLLDDSSALYLVWDTDDHGPNLLTWPAENRIAYSGVPAVSSAAATYTFSKATVPAGAFMRVIATSNVRLIGGYVKLGAYQYVNTDVSATLVHGLSIKYRYVGTATGGDYASLMGGVLDNDFTIGKYGTRMYLRWRGTANTSMFGGSTDPNTGNHVITVANRVASLDGTPQISNLAAGAMGTIDRPVILGATWNNTSPYTDLSGRYLHAEWYYATLYDSENGALVNLVPALRGDVDSPEAVFYDTVTGACFAHAGGTGTLEYGGDVTNTVACASAASPSLCNGRTATWTGFGDRSNVNDPANWSCTDETGATVVSAPDAYTNVKIEDATTFNVPAGQTLSYASLEFNNVSLAADCDWRGLASMDTWVQPGEHVDIDLAGHRLTVVDLAGTGTITDSVGGGELHVSVADGLVVENTGMTLAGSLKLVKEGAGVLVGKRAGQTYTGGTLVSGGWLKRGVNDRPFGAQGALITVADGAAFDWKGGWTNGGTSTAYDFSIAGSGPDGNGAIVSSVVCGTWNVGAIADLELAGDALIGGYGGWGFNYVDNTAAQTHTVTMNGHTLSIKIRGTSASNTGSFHFRNVTTVGSGTIAIIDHDTTSPEVFPAFFAHNQSDTYGSDLSSVTFDLGEGYSISPAVEVKVGTFIDRRSNDISHGDKSLTVLDRFKPMTTNLVRSVTLGDVTHLDLVLDLRELDGPFVLPSATHSLSAAAGATVRVDLGGRKTSNRRPIVSWTTPPTGVSFAWPDGVSGKGRLVMKDDGLYVAKSFVIIVR